MDTLEKALEEKLMAEADQMIDEAIPPGGASSFETPLGPAIMGLGLVGDDDLMASGTAAFAGLGDLGRFAFRRFRNKLRGVLRGKKERAKVALKQAATAQKTALKTAKETLTRAKMTGNPFQRVQLLKKADAAAKAAKVAEQAAKKHAKDVVNPKVTRLEAKDAIRPVIKEAAQGVAAGQRVAINRLAALQKTNPALAMKLRKDPKALKADVDQIITQKVAQEIAPGVAVATAPARPMPKMMMRPGVRLRVARGKPSMAPAPLPGTRMAQPSASALRLGPAVVRPVLPPPPPPTDWLEGVSGFLGAQDLTDTGSAAFADIVDTWESSDVF